MNQRSFWMIFVLMGWVLGCSQAPPAPTPHVPTVDVALPRAEMVSDYEDFTGNTDAVYKVDIRARVSGYLDKVAFSDGDHVKKDVLLYQIDPRPFQAELDRAKAEVERLEAEKKLLDIQVARYRKLAATGAGSQQDLDEYLAKQAENIGGLKAAKAQVEKAALNLGFTTIRAPIDGKMSRTLLTAGNLVNADSTLLTTLMSIDPMYAYFDIEEPAFLEILELVRKGVVKSRQLDDIPVHMALATDKPGEFPLHGSLDFLNNTIDPQTGTIQVRGKFANPYDPKNHIPPLLTPGSFVRVRLEESLPHKALLIAERAIGTDQGHKYVFVIDENNTAAYRQVELGMTFFGLRAITKGLHPTDRVALDNLQRLRPEMKVEPKLVKMTADAEEPQSPGGPKGKGRNLKQQPVKKKSK
jgi:RND family efflux transporter MFP subunit